MQNMRWMQMYADFNQSTTHMTQDMRTSRIVLMIKPPCEPKHKIGGNAPITTTEDRSPDPTEDRSTRTSC